MNADFSKKLDVVAGDGVDYHQLSVALRELRGPAGNATLLSDLMSLMLSNDEDGERFKPFFTLQNGSSSFSLEMLTTEDVGELREIESTNAAVRARISDVIWGRLTGQERVKHVHVAIDAYMNLAPKARPFDADGYLLRAHELATRFRGTDDGERAGRVRDEVSRRVGASDTPARLLSASRLLRRIEPDKQEAETTRIALSAAADSSRAEGDPRMARELTEELRNWTSSDEVRADLGVRVADLWVAEADSRMDGGDPSALVAASFIENAIQTLRAIPRKQRDRLGVESRVLQLRLRMSRLNEAALDEMSVFESDPVDVSDAARYARSRVKGLPALEALLEFTSLFPLADEARDRADAEEVLASSVARIFPTTTYTSDARVSDKSDEAASVDRQIGESMRMRHTLCALGMIVPALQQLREDHALTLRDFVRLAHRSAVVPLGSEGLFAQGLHAGWELRMDVAAHLLTPRIEATVRHHLKAADLPTTLLSRDGREDEVSLPALLDRSEVADVFGSDVAYELKGLYAGRFGQNLRHDVAHGLLHDSSANTTATIYAWWFVLRLVLTPFFNRKTAASGAPQESD